MSEKNIAITPEMQKIIDAAVTAAVTSAVAPLVAQNKALADKNAALERSRAAKVHADYVRGGTAIQFWGFTSKNGMQYLVPMPIGEFAEFAKKTLAALETGAVVTGREYDETAKTFTDTDCILHDETPEELVSRLKARKAGMATAAGSLKGKASDEATKAFEASVK